MSLIYFKSGQIIAENGLAKVYHQNDNLFLEIGPGHTLWALESEITDYIDQISGIPKGDCLEIGLGLGVASRLILSHPSVTSLTTIEKNQDVIKCHSKIDDKYRKDKHPYRKHVHKIINQDGLVFCNQTKNKYDFIFIDCYANIDEDSLPLIQDLARSGARLLRPGGIITGWFDPYTPQEFIDPFYKIFELANTYSGTE